MAKPCLKSQRGNQVAHGNLTLVPRFLQRFKKPFFINDADGTTDHGLSYLHHAGPFCRTLIIRLWWNEAPWLPFQDFIRDDTYESSRNQGTTLPHTHELFPRDGAGKFPQVPVHVGVADLAEQRRYFCTVVKKCHEPSLVFQPTQQVLNTRQRTEQFCSGRVAAKSGVIPTNKSWMEPRERAVYGIARTCH